MICILDDWTWKPRFEGPGANPLNGNRSLSAGKEPSLGIMDGGSGRPLPAPLDGVRNLPGDDGKWNVPQYTVPALANIQGDTASFTKASP